MEVSDEILNALDKHDELAAQYEALQAEAAALAAHEGKDAELLGSPEYAAYLAAVEAYNAHVQEFNEAAAEYNAAVEAYNAAVDTYNTNKPADSSSSTGTGTVQGTADIDWGNIDIDGNLGHIDVKYQAAASMDVTIENGEPSYSDTVTQYEVTGVYTDETAADGGNSTDYGLNFDNDGSGEQAPGVQELNKDEGYDEFGSNHGFNQDTYEEVDSPDTAKTYYIKYGHSYVEIEYNESRGEWYTTGRNAQSVNLNRIDVYEKVEHDKVSLDPAAGTVSFYVTLEDSNGDDHGINVNLNAGSVYADGSYYKAKYDYWGNETDFLNQYEDSKGGTIPVEWIENEDGVKEKYYNISGQSVFLISALTCDGMRGNENGDLSPDGLDLILNLQTMIEIHRADNAQKLSYLGYELGVTAQAKEVTDPGEFTMEKPDMPEPTERLEKLAHLDKLDEKVVIDFGEPIEELKHIDTIDKIDPIDLIETDPIDPIDTIDPIEGIDLIETDPIDPIDTIDPIEGIDLIETDPIDPIDTIDPIEGIDLIETDPIDPIDTIDPIEGIDLIDLLETIEEMDLVDIPDEPVVLNDNFPVDDGFDTDFAFEVEIPDEEVPLAAAPKTGDISGLWSILSGISAAGMFLLGRKRRDEE